MSMKNRKHCEVSYSLSGIQSVTGVVRHGRLRWFGHLKHKSGEWVVGRDMKRGSISGQTFNPS